MGELKARFISFEDLKPKGSILNECTGGIGIDSKQNVYFAVSDFNDPNDVVLFRYSTKKGAKEFLGTVRGISAAQGNLGPNRYWHGTETIAKVHSSILEYEGKMFFSSHDYRSIPKKGFEYLCGHIDEHRGGHFYSFDLVSEAFEDLSKSDDYGVSVRHQGIIALNILRRHRKLVGFTYPLGDILIYDLAENRSSLYPGPPEYKYCDVGREIVVTKKGKIYFFYVVDDFWLMELDIETGMMKRTDKRNILRNGYIQSMVSTKDGNTVYLLDNDGYLYVFHVQDERLEVLGSLLPSEEITRGLSITFVRALVLSNDEKKLYSMPSIFDKGTVAALCRKKLVKWVRAISPSARRAISSFRQRLVQNLVKLHEQNNAFGCTLYEYDIETGNRTAVATFASIVEGNMVTGNGVIDDQGRIYFGYHSVISNSVRLLQIYDDSNDVPT